MNKIQGLNIYLIQIIKTFLFKKRYNKNGGEKSSFSSFFYCISVTDFLFSIALLRIKLRDCLNLKRSL